MRYIFIYIIPTFCSSLILIKYDLPQYLFHAIRYSSHVILHFHCFSKVFRCSLFHTEMYWENRLLFRIARKKIYQSFQAAKYDIKQHSDATYKINLSYWELFGPFLLNNLLRLLMGLVWTTFTFCLNSNIHICFYFSRRLFAKHHSL